MGCRRLGIQFLEDVEQGLVVQGTRLGRGIAVGENDGGPFLPRQRFGAEGPAGAHDEVAGHAQFLGLVKSHAQHIDPLVAEPDERRDAQVILVLLSGKGHGVDLHAGDAGFLQEVQFAPDFIGRHLIAVPPPAHIGPIGVVRIPEGFQDFPIVSAHKGQAGHDDGQGQ